MFEAECWPADESQDYMGPVINDKARKTILDYIEIGKKEGRLLTGGEAGDRIGILRPADGDRRRRTESRLFREEIFGPVLAVTKARDFDHALELANDSEYGLTGAVFTEEPREDREGARPVLCRESVYQSQMTGAMVGAHPFGGFNMSGTDSKAGGPDYLLQFLQAKSIAERID